MSKLTVHVLKPSHLVTGHAEDAMFIARQTQGPLTYKLVNVDYERPTPNDLFKDCSGSDTRRDVNEHERSIEDMNDRDAMDTPVPTESGLEWIDRLEDIEQQYRRNHDVPDADFVIVLSTRGNLDNYFVIPRFDGHRMAGIQLNHFVTQKVKSHILVGYYLMALPVMLTAYADESMFSYLARHAHEDLRGCLNDVAQEDVSKLNIKTKTADICTECKRHFQDQDLDWNLVRQMREGLELVRSLQINLEDFLEGYVHPSLTIGMKPKFEDLGLTVPLSPKEMAVYVTFLESGAQGIAMNDLDQHRDQLYHAYGHRYRGTDVQEISRVVDGLTDPLAEDLQQVISKVNRKFRSTVGEERAAPYLISGERGKPKSISLSRNLIRRV